MAPSIVRQIAHTLGVRGVTFLCRAGLAVILGRVLRPDAYGIYALVSTIATFGVILTGLNLHAYVFRTVPGESIDNQFRLFKATSLFEFATTSLLVGGVLALGLLPRIAALFNAAGYEQVLALGFLVLLLLVALTEAIQFLSAQARVEQANWVDFLSQAAWVPVILGLWALGVHIGILDVLVAQSVGCMAALALAAFMIGPAAWWRTVPDWSIIRRGLAFSLPMAVPALSLYSLKLADRFFLSYFHGLADVGIYSFTYTLINTLYAFTAGVIFNTFGPRIFAAHNTGDYDRRNLLQTYMVKIALACFILPLGALILVAHPLIAAFARPEYLRAIGPLPLVGLSYVFNILGYPAHYLLLMKHQVRRLVAIEVVGMIIGIAGNVLLIPALSYNGAAIASAVGFGAIMVAKYAVSGTWTTLRTDVLLSVADELKVLRQYHRRIRRAAD